MRSLVALGLLAACSAAPASKAGAPSVAPPPPIDARVPQADDVPCGGTSCPAAQYCLEHLGCASGIPRPPNEQQAVDHSFTCVAAPPTGYAAAECSGLGGDGHQIRCNCPPRPGAATRP
jgi:hypothetical protein|nr:hypothetical protein [Kofleriaceae bacterium]